MVTLKSANKKVLFYLKNKMDYLDSISLYLVLPSRIDSHHSSIR